MQMQSCTTAEVNHLVYSLETVMPEAGLINGLDWPPYVAISIKHIQGACVQPALILEQYERAGCLS